jgi:hypothetical protein
LAAPPSLDMRAATQAVATMFTVKSTAESAG